MEINDCKLYLKEINIDLTKFAVTKSCCSPKLHAVTKKKIEPKVMKPNDYLFQESSCSENYPSKNK